MKTNQILLGTAILALGFTSCKNNDDEMRIKRVDTYTVYVDSVGNVAAADAKNNWAAIDAEYDRRVMDADAAIGEMSDKTAAQERLDASKARYQALKDKYNAELEAEKQAMNDPQVQLRDSFFGPGKIGKDMNFDWVNKDNILTVFNDFNNTFEANKDKYSREDMDMVKAIYEGLGARKNTVENEGLSTADNLKIAELKLKLAPKMKIARMGAKAEETKEAKK